MFERTLDWIVENPELTGMAISLLITIATIIVQRGVAGVRSAVQEIMHAAERARRQGHLPVDGPMVFEWVVSRAMMFVVPMAPAWLRPYLTEERIRNMVQKLFDGALDWIDDGAVNGSNKSPADPEAANEVAAAIVKELEKKPPNRSRGHYL